MSEADVSRETGTHFCSACGQLHGAEQADSAVEIARIQAERDVKVAQIERGISQHNAEVYAETDIAVAEIHGDAGVAEAEALADGIADSGDGAEVPVITDVPAPDVEPEVQETIAPRDEEDDLPSVPAEKSAWSYW